jgi:zinc protease
MMTAVAHTSPKARADRVQKLTSPQGLRVWLVEDYTVPLIALECAWAGGAAQDPKGKSGLAAMMAGLLDEGAGALDSHAFHRALDDKAIEISFSAGRDHVRGHVKTLSKNATDAFELLRLAVNEPRFDDDALERIRAQMTAALKRDAKDPDVLAGKLWREMATLAHPYGAPVNGDLESVAAMTRADIVDAHQHMITRAHLHIAVVGAIDALTLLELVDQAFGALPMSSSLQPIADIILPNERLCRVVDVDVPQSTIRFGMQGILRKDPDFMAAMVVNHILGGGVFSARLFREVREKRGLAYSVHSQLVNYDHAAFLSGGTSTKNERAAESLAVIEEEISKLAHDGPSAEELDKAKKYLIGSYDLRFDTSTKIANQLVGLQLEDFDASYLDERNPLIDAVTHDHALRVAKSLLGDKKLIIAIAGRPQGL